MEAEVIQSFIPDLVTAVSDSVLSVSDQCLAKGLINETVYKRVLESGGTSEDKARTLILAVKKSTETDSRCLEILLNILDQELPFAIRENLLSKIRKELTEKASTCSAVVPLSKAVQQVPLGELSKEIPLQQSSLLGRFEDSIRQHEHACAEKKHLKERLKVKSETCEKLKGELETLKGQNEEQASNTQSRIEVCMVQIENLEKRIEQLQKNIEEQGMRARRGRNTIITKTDKMFFHIAQQSQQEIKKRDEQLKTVLNENEAFKQSLTKAEDEIRMKEREYKVIVQEKELRTREMVVEIKEQQHKESPSRLHKAQVQSVVKPPDVLEEYYLANLCDDLSDLLSGRDRGVSLYWKDFALHLGLSISDLKDIEASLKKKYVKPSAGNIITEIMEEWLQHRPGDSRGSTSYPTYSRLKGAIFNTDFLGLGEWQNLISYEELSKYKL